MKAILPLLTVLCFTFVSAAEQNLSQIPKLNRAPGTSFDLQGIVRQRTAAITRNWLLTAPDRNPAILEMFADRDKNPPRDLLPWSGEFAGKYLTGAVQILRLDQDPALRAKITAFADQFVRLQADDGYLGPFPPDNHLLGKGGTWDAWGHYHAMLGLLLWHEESGDPKALAAAKKIGDLLVRTFLNSGKRLVDTKNAEMNHAPIHSLCLLYKATGGKSYLDLARQIASEFEDQHAGDYIRTAEAGREFFQGPKPRWESLHPIQGLAELYWITGDDRFRKAFEHHWWSIAKLDRHNNGGFSSGEQAQGNPYHPGAIETCCTVTWIAMSVDMLRLTGNPIVADELELSTLNQVIGYQHPSGRSCTYNTPMDGIRRPSMEEIGFQIRPGSEEINCCSANAPRGFGMLSDWALMTDGAGLTVDWYGPLMMKSRVGETPVTLTQTTDYPRGGVINLRVTPDRPLKFPLRLRIPHWSETSRVAVNGDPVESVAPGTYVSIDREWKAGDEVTIAFDMSLRFWAGERDCTGKASIYRGPLLLVHESQAQPETPIRFSPEWKVFGEIHASNTPKAEFAATFEGSAIVWEGRRFDDAGIARVYIDGEEIATVDQYADARGLPFRWEYDRLKPGKHEVKIVVTSDRNAASKGLWINVSKLGPHIPGPPMLDSRTLVPHLAEPQPDEAQLLLDVHATDGSRVQLRDYGTAGHDGRRYVSWLPVRNVEPADFSRSAPFRSGVLPTADRIILFHLIGIIRCSE